MYNTVQHFNLIELSSLLENKNLQVLRERLTLKVVFPTKNYTTGASFMKHFINKYSINKLNIHRQHTKLQRITLWTLSLFRSLTSWCRMFRGLWLTEFTSIKITAVFVRYVTIIVMWKKICASFRRTERITFDITVKWRTDAHRTIHP